MMMFKKIILVAASIIFIASVTTNYYVKNKLEEADKVSEEWEEIQNRSFAQEVHDVRWDVCSQNKEPDCTELSKIDLYMDIYNEYQFGKPMKGNYVE